MKRKLELSIVLPAYRERKNLAVFVPQIEREFRHTPIEIIVVDDNSQDGTRELLGKLSEKYKNIVLIERPQLSGIGSALRDGYNKARGGYILSSDADLSFSVADMRLLYEKIQNGFDLVLGYRVNHELIELEKKTFLGWCEIFIFSPLSNFIIRFLAGIRLRNYNTNFRIVRSATWRSIRTVEDRQFFLFEVIFRAKRQGAKIVEVPVTFYPRKFGKSKVSFLKQAPAYFFKLIRYSFLDRSY